MKRIILSALLLLALAAQAATTPVLLSKVNRQAMQGWVDNAYSHLTPDQRIAQIIVMAVSPGREDARRQVDKYVKQYKVGGLIYEKSDIATQVELTDYAQAQAQIPLLIALDAEWGLGMRMSDAPSFPHNLLLGGVTDEKLLYEYGKEVARECRLVGVHVNFAPVLDVIDRPGTVVGERSFGYDPQVVARNGVAFAKGLEDGGVLSTAKHFPGHGSTIADSHKELPILTKSLQEMQTYDLVPFRKYVEAGLGGMLTAHIDVDFLNDGTRPCSLSKECVTGLLRNELGFEGLIFTDALDMEGAKTVAGDPSVNAILAGNDVLLMPHDIETAILAIKQAISDGLLSWNDIETRCRKVLSYKYALRINDTAKRKHDTRILASQINTEYAADLNRRLIAAAVTVAVNRKNTLPVASAEGVMPVVALGLVENSMFERRCASYMATTADWSGAKRCVIAIADPAYREKALNIARACKNTVVVVLAAPEKLALYADLLTDSHVSAVVTAYGSDDTWQDYAAQTVFGGSDATGTLPVTVKSAKNNKVLRAGTGVKYRATRLGYTLPVEVGFKDDLLAKIDSICNYGVQQGAFPGCQVVVARHGKVVVDRCYGEINSGSGVPVTGNTLFGLASVSKATGTLSGVMKLYDDGKFRLDEPASKYIAGLRGTDKQDITFRQLLYHETGMQPSLSMWDMMFDPATYTGKLITGEPTETNTIKIMKGAYGHKDAKLRTDILSTTPTAEFNMPIAEGIYGGKVTYDSVMNRIYHSQLRPNKNYCYSCLNFCLLANALQNISHRRLDQFVDDNIFAPLGANRTTYLPLNRFSPDEIAYTEVDTYLRRQHIHGYVHDELAAFSGGVQGNAGLFANANDLAKLCQMWLNGGTYGGHRFYKQTTTDLFLKSKSPNSHRGLGFDKPNTKNLKASSTCDEATPETVGHTGFTGTCYWIDPANDMIYIFLSNRVCPTRDNPAFTRVSARSHIHTLLLKSIINQ